MKNRAITITIILLILAIGNYFRISNRSNVRAVEFVSILSIGALAGILIHRIAQHSRNSNKD